MLTLIVSLTIGLCRSLLREAKRVSLNVVFVFARNMTLTVSFSHGHSSMKLSCPSLLTIGEYVAQVSVQPLLHEDDPNEKKFELELHVRLECDMKWVKHPKSVVLCHSGRSFETHIDTTFFHGEGDDKISAGDVYDYRPLNRSLKAGAYFTEILGYHLPTNEAGPIFRIPVTVIVPETFSISPPLSSPQSPPPSPSSGDDRIVAVSSDKRVLLSAHSSGKFPDASLTSPKFEPFSQFCKVYTNVSFHAGHIVRKFLAIPNNATMVCIRIKAVHAPSKRKFVLHCLQHDPLCAHRDTSYRRYLDIFGTREQIVRLSSFHSHCVLIEIDFFSFFWCQVLGPCLCKHDFGSSIGTVLEQWW